MSEQPPGYTPPGYVPAYPQPAYPPPGYAEQPGYPPGSGQQPGYPQPGYPQPGYPQGQGYGAPQAPWPPYGAPAGPGGPYFPPPPRGRRKWPYFLALGIVLFFAVIGIGAYAIYKSTLAPVQQAVDDYYGDLASGDDAGAYALLCSSETTGPNATLSDFMQLVDTKPVRRWHSTGVTSRSSTGVGSVGTVTGTVTYKDGTTRSGTIFLTKEAGSWKVCTGPILVPAG